MAERTSLKLVGCRFESRPGHSPSQSIFLDGLIFKTWHGRQLADHFGLAPEMLWARIPPGLPILHPRSITENERKLQKTATFFRQKEFYRLLQGMGYSQGHACG